MRQAVAETVTRDLVSVEVGDDYRIEVWQRRKTMDYTPSEARTLGHMLLNTAAHAVELISEHEQERHARTLAGALGSDLVLSGTSGCLGTENGADGRTAAHAHPIPYREGCACWFSGGVLTTTSRECAFHGHGTEGTGN